MKVKLYTLGCKVNYCETKKLEGEFVKAGFSVVQAAEDADVFVINSCTVTAKSDAKTRRLLGRVRRRNTGAIVVLTGCFASVYCQKAQSLGADLVLPNSEKDNLVFAVQEKLSQRGKKVENKAEKAPVLALKTRTRAFIKIQDGCERFCSYCIIPYARGASRFLPLNRLKEEVSQAAKRGYKEVVLVGINLFLFGRGREYDLADAVEVASEPEGIKRVRLGSLEPEALSDRTVLKLAAEPKFCPHFHVSLQSGCQRTLEQMNRHYSLQEYKLLLSQLRGRFANPAITTDVIVGFPGETDADFRASLDFVLEQNFAKIHVFPYSRRPGTRADTMPDQIENATKIARVCAMLDAAKAAAKKFNEQQVGTRQLVLLEEQTKTGELHGHLPNYVDVWVAAPKSLSNQICEVEIFEAGAKGCRGRLV